MIGIYKITNKINGKMYICQSNNINRRFQEHRYKGEKSGIPLDMAIQKHGKENFTFEILEECSIDKLAERETYWIKYYNTVEQGYNCNYGGENATIGVNNGRAILNDQEVIMIREAYNNHKRKREVYKLVEDKITFATFEQVWEGRTWRHIMPEVYTEENKLYYTKQTTLGELSYTAKFTDKEILELRKRYVNETAREIWNNVSDRCSYQTLQQILWGRNYKHLPIYSKKLKKWIEPVSTIPEA